MQFPRDKSLNWASRLWKWFTSRMVEEVPESVAVCEFACRKTECLLGEWNTCANRKRGMDLNKGSNS